MKRAAKRIVIGVAVAAVLVAAAGAWLVGTESGLRAAWRLGRGFVPAEVEVGTLAGRLVGPLVLTDVRYASQSLAASAQRIELEWQPSRLLRGLLSVDSLRVVAVDVVRREPAEASSSSAPLEVPERLSLPVDVAVDAVSIEDVRVRASPEAPPILVDGVRFGFRLDDERLAIDALDVRAPLFDVTGRAELAPADHYPGEVALDAVIRPPDRPEAAVTLRGSGTIDELEVRLGVAPPYEVDAELVVADILERIRLGGTVHARLVPAELGLDVPVREMTADLALEGPLDELRLTGSAEAALAELLDVRLELAARWLGSAVEIDMLDVAERDGPGAVRLAGRIDLADEPSAALAGDWSGLRWPLDGEPLAASPRGTLELRGTPDRLEARLDAAWDADGRIDGIVRRDDERLDVELEWQNVSWPPNEARLESRQGGLRIAGTLDDYTLALDAQLAAAGDIASGLRADGAAGHLRAEGRGDRRSFDLALVDVAVLDGSLKGSGRLGLDPAPSAGLDVEFARLDPGLLVPEWAGRVDGGIEAEATLVDGGLTASVARLDVAGALRGRPIDLDGRGRYDAPKDATIEALTLRSGESMLVASGRIGERIDLEWRVDSPNLDDFWPGLAGRLVTSGRATGPLTRPLVEVDAEGEALALDGIEISRLSISGKVDAGGQAESDLALEVHGARIGERSVERVAFRADGNAERHAVSADVSAEGVESALALTGTFERPWEPDFAWRFELDEATIAPAALPAWALAAPAAGTLTADGAEIARSCFSSGGAELCVEAVQRNGRTDLGLDLSALPFAYFAAYLPRDTRVTGELSGRGTLELGRELAPRASLTLATTPARIATTRTNSGSVPALAFEPGSAAFTFDGRRLNAEVDLPLARGQGGIDARGFATLRDGESLAASAVNGALRAEFDNLGFLSGLVAGVEGTTGSLAVDIALIGTAGAPQITGTVALRDGSARLREPGIVVEDVDVVLEGDGSGRLTIEGSARSGGGALEAEGVLRFADSLAVGRLAVRGDTVELANTPDAQLWASPDLALDLTPERIDLTGSVRIPRARFTPRGTIEGAETVSGDQIIVDAEESAGRPLSRPFYARVALSLGDDVTFDGFGLTARLGGGLEIVEVPAEPVTGSGEVRVESGTYEAYGQELEVRTGRLLFAGGAVSRPGLDIEAVRRPTEDILVGARVRGTLDRPELSVFSEPPMPREEQLSYLLLGRPLAAASGSETSALSQAALALGLRGGNFVSDRLNQALGFDEFGIQTQPAEASSASFVIGKYLTPSLYVSYGVGLFEPVNTLRLRYTISRRWRLVTESSTAASGGDLIYHIERGD